MTTRKIRSLVGEGKNARIVNRLVVYDENGNQTGCYAIHKDKLGREFYYPHNPYNKFGLFTDRPKDAIECIRNGLGDGFAKSSILGLELGHVVRFLDREVGEYIRHETIEGWKDTKFAYGVKFCYLNSLSNGRPVLKSEALKTMWDKAEDILTFETEDEASTFIDSVNEKAKYYHEQYLKLPKEGDEGYDYENIIKPFFNKIEGDVGVSSVYWATFSALDEEYRCGENVYKMVVTQVVLPKKEEE